MELQLLPEARARFHTAYRLGPVKWAALLHLCPRLSCPPRHTLVCAHTCTTRVLHEQVYTQAHITFCTLTPTTHAHKAFSCTHLYTHTLVHGTWHTLLHVHTPHMWAQKENRTPLPFSSVLQGGPAVVRGPRFSFRE